VRGFLSFLGMGGDGTWRGCGEVLFRASPSSQFEIGWVLKEIEIALRVMGRLCVRLSSGRVRGGWPLSKNPTPNCAHTRNASQAFVAPGPARRHNQVPLRRFLCCHGGECDAGWPRRADKETAAAEGGPGVSERGPWVETRQWRHASDSHFTQYPPSPDRLALTRQGRY
jgi:hypothetical protein